MFWIPQGARRLFRLHWTLAVLSGRMRKLNGEDLSMREDSLHKLRHSIGHGRKVLRIIGKTYARTKAHLDVLRMGPTKAFVFSKYQANHQTLTLSVAFKSCAYDNDY